MKYLLFTLCCAWQCAGAQIITTIAGNSTAASTGNGGPAIAASLWGTSGVAVDRKGNIYISEAAGIRKIDTFGIISRYAGDSVYGCSGNGVPATTAHISWPGQLATDMYGNLYFCDQECHSVRKVDTNGIIYTLAGDNNTMGDGYWGDGGLARYAKLYSPGAIAVDDSAHNIYICDVGNNVIRKIDRMHYMSTFAGNSTVFTDPGDGIPATAAYLDYAQGITVDKEGNVFVACGYQCRVRKIDTGGIISTWAGLANINCSGYTGDGGPATTARLNYPTGVAIGDSGHLFVLDAQNHNIRKVTTAGIISTYAGAQPGGFGGDGGLAVNALFSSLTGLAYDGRQSMYVTDSFRLRKIGPGTPVHVLPATPSAITIRTYPNPAVNELNVVATAGINSIMIADLTGRELFRSVYNSTEVRLDVSALSPGVYLLRVNKEQCRRFVKM